jgi:hypothetical protein
MGHSKNCIRDSKYICIACSTFIIHIIFQRSFNTWKKTKNNIFRIVSVVRYSICLLVRMWFAIVIACLSLCEFGATCNVSNGKYFVNRN